MKTLLPFRWQSELEERAIGTWHGPQTPTMRLDNGATDRQSHPDTLGFGGKEWLENKGCLPRIESPAGILNLDQHTIRVLLRLNEQLAWPVRDCTHRIDAIHDQID